jgi:carbon-monoxide dehydrogenase small subunit
MVINAYALLLKTPRAKREEIIKEMDGNLCRCGAHVRILDAIEEAGVAMQGGKR